MSRGSAFDIKTLDIQTDSHAKIFFLPIFGASWADATTGNRAQLKTVRNLATTNSRHEGASVSYGKIPPARSGANSD
jgi:hypothetical protein